MENNFSPLDEMAKNLFEDFTVDPEPGSWEKVQHNLESQPLDEAFRDGLSHLESAPSDKVWEGVERNLPLLPALRTYAATLLKIAAVLLIGFSLPFLLMKKENISVAANSAQKKKVTAEVTFKQVMEQANILKEKKNIVEPKTINFRKRKRKTEAELLLTALLMDDDEFPDSLLNLKRLQQILQPIEPLPIISATASAGLNAPLDALPLLKPKVKTTTADFTISVPLIVVEADEVDGLIEMYDKNN